MYNTTAFLYEHIAGFKQPEAVCRTVHELLAGLGVAPPGTLGDLGAGTGLLSVRLAERGWKVYGVELSEAMLAVAQEKTAALPPDTQARLSWTRDDISDFQVPVPLDGALCLHNTINHLVEWAQVEGFARSVHRALRPGGVLVLDSDTLATFQGFFNHGPVVVWQDDTHRVTRACEFDAPTGRANHTAILERCDTGGSWVRVSEEAMPLQYHAEEALHEAFCRAGFELVHVAPFNPSPHLYPAELIPKVLWAFRKPVPDL